METESKEHSWKNLKKSFGFESFQEKYYLLYLLKVGENLYLQQSQFAQVTLSDTVFWQWT